MIRINLLPHEMRHKEVRKLNIPVVPVLTGIFLLFLLASLFNLFIHIQKRGELRRLEAQWESLKVKNAEAEALQRELGMGVKAEADFYDSVIDPPLETARVLGVINELIPDNVWMSDLRYDRKPDGHDVLINGFAEESQKESDLVVIQNFANAIKEQLDLFAKSRLQKGPLMDKPFTVTVQTVSAQREVKGTKVTQFTIVCQQKQ